MVTIERNYNVLIISSLIVLFSILLLMSSVNLIKELQKNNQFTGFAINQNPSDTKITNQTQSPQEIYSIKAYTIFYLSLIFIIIVVVIISLILIIPKLKKYT